MPIYVYIAADRSGSCDRCREGFDVLHGISEKGPEKCPDCGAPVARKISAPFISRRPSAKSLLNPDYRRKRGFKTGAELLESGDIKLD